MWSKQHPTSERLWCFCTRQVANQTLNQSCSAVLYWIPVESSEKTVNKKCLRHVGFADARLIAFAAGWPSEFVAALFSTRLPHCISVFIWPLWWSLTIVTDPLLCARHPDGICMARLNQPDGLFHCNYFSKFWGDWLTHNQRWPEHSFSFVQGCSRQDFQVFHCLSPGFSLDFRDILPNFWSLRRWYPTRPSNTMAFNARTIRLWAVLSVSPASSLPCDPAAPDSFQDIS